jgi:hypothetical protein
MSLAGAVLPLGWPPPLPPVFCSRGGPRTSSTPCEEAPVELMQMAALRVLSEITQAPCYYYIVSVKMARRLCHVDDYTFLVH